MAQTTRPERGRSVAYNYFERDYLGAAPVPVAELSLSALHAVEDELLLGSVVNPMRCQRS